MAEFASRFRFPPFTFALRNSLKIFLPGIIVWRTCRSFSERCTDSGYSILVSERALFSLKGALSGEYPSERNEISGSDPSVLVAVEIHNLILLFLRKLLS